MSDVTLEVPLVDGAEVLNIVDKEIVKEFHETLNRLHEANAVLVRRVLEQELKLEDQNKRLKELERRNGIHVPTDAPVPTTVETCHDGKSHEYHATMGRTRMDAPPAHCVKCGRTKGQ